MQRLDVSMEPRGNARCRRIAAAITMLRRFRRERSFVRRAGSGYRSSRTIGPAHNARFSLPSTGGEKGVNVATRWKNGGARESVGTARERGGCAGREKERGGDGEPGKEKWRYKAKIGDENGGGR